MPARPSLSWVAWVWVRSATSALPMPRWNWNASLSAHLYSNVWNPPGVRVSPPSVVGAAVLSSQASKLTTSKGGMTASIAGVQVGRCRRDRVDRQFHAGPGVHPGDGHYSGRGRHTCHEPSDDLIRRSGRRLVVQAHPRDGRAGPRGGQAQRLVCGEEVVFGGEDLLVRSQPQSAVHQPEAHRRAVSQCDVCVLGSEIARGRVENSAFEVPLVLDQIPQGVLVESAPVQVERGADLTRRRGQHERREVGEVPGERELVADRCPVGRVERAGIERRCRPPRPRPGRRVRRLCSRPVRPPWPPFRSR